MAADVDVLHVKRQRRLVLLPPALAHKGGGPSHRECRLRLYPRLTSELGVRRRGTAGVGQTWGQVISQVAGRGDVRVHEVAREGDVGPGVAVQSVLRTLLQQQPDGVQLPQTDHHALTLDLPPSPEVVIIGNGLHLLTVLHQNHRQHLLRKFSHREGKVVRSGDPAAEVSGVWVEVPSDVDHEPVEGHRPLVPSQDAVGSRGREGRAELCGPRRCMKG